MKWSFGRRKSVRRQLQRAADPRRFKRLPPRVELRNTITSSPVSPARDPEGGRDTDRDFVIRYGDPFDDGG